MDAPEEKSPAVLPKIRKNLAYRTLFFVLVVGSLIYGLMWFLKVRNDLKGMETSNTAGWISAVKYLPQGNTEAVLISPDGTVHTDPGYLPNTNDRDLAWSPGGNFLYFASDRNEHNFNIYRWSPSSTDPSEQRTLGTRARGDLTFPAQPVTESDREAKGLLTTGGVVQEFDPSTTTTAQVLPPTQKEITVASGGDESGTTEGQFEGVYGSLGTSFRLAQWCNNHKSIVAIMRRENGETMILQDMQPVDGKVPAPRPLFSGERLEFAVNPKDGSLVYTVQGFQWPGSTPPTDKDGKPMKKPFINGLGILGTDGRPLILATNNGEAIFHSPAVSMDGSAVAVVVDQVVKGVQTTAGLVTYPTSQNPNFKPLRLRGDIHEPSWSLDGQHIVAVVKQVGKPRTIFEIPVDGSSQPRNITGDAGDFGFPRYSPQQKGG